MPGKFKTNGKRISSSQFNLEGYPVEQIIYNPDGSVLQQTNNLYDSQGHLKEILTISSNVNLSEKMVFKYNNSDLMTEAVVYDINNGIKAKVENTYDINGRIVEILTKVPNSNVAVKILNN